MDAGGEDQIEELTLEPLTVVRSRRPRALWGVLAAVAVAAGALVVTSSDGDGTSRPGLPVAFGSAAGRDAAGAEADSMLAFITYVAGDDLPALGGEAPAYRLSGNVDEGQVRALADALGLEGEIVHEGPIWRVVGEAGTLEVYEGGGAQWSFSSTSYTALDVGSGSSSGSAGVDSGVECTVTTPPGDRCDLPTQPTYVECYATDGASGCPAPECPPGADCPVPLPEPILPPDADCASIQLPDCPDDAVPPADLPSEDEARAIALDLLAATGLDTDGAVVTVDGPYDAWYVTVEPQVDGLHAGLVPSVAVGPEGAITNAAGFLGAPERLGEYPVLTTREAIDRANAQMAEGGWSGYAPGVPAGDIGIAECEASDGAGDDCVSTLIDCPEDNPDCNSVGVVVDEPVTTVVTQCKVQADGSEICEIEPGITCPQLVPPADEPVAAPETVCTPPVPDPAPAPEPIEIVLVDAEPSLVLLGAVDGSPDAYLVPGYRFTDADDGTVDLPAVADEALTGAPETTVPPESIVPDPGGKPPVDPQPCGEVLVEEDESGTTHTVQPNPDCVGTDPVTLAPGEEPQLGVGYYVDIDLECEAFKLGGEIWLHDGGDMSAWQPAGEPFEGGTFTLTRANTARSWGTRKA